MPKANWNDYYKNIGPALSSRLRNAHTNILGTCKIINKIYNYGEG